MSELLNRRVILGIGATLGAFSRAKAAIIERPRLGVVARIGEKISPDEAIAKVHSFGLPTCQLSVGPAPDVLLAAPIRTALEKYEVEATAIMTLGPGRMVWDFYSGPDTIGIVPPATRVARIDALKRASDLAKACRM